MDRATALLRRYVVRRASGAYPCPEYACRITIEGTGNVWLRCDERAARASDRWRRIRAPGKPWCRILGPILDIAMDVELQSFFTAIADDDWYRFEREVRRHPRQCLSEWRAAGRRLIVAAKAAAAGYRAPGNLSGWPIKRGTGPRSLAPER